MGRGKRKEEEAKAGEAKITPPTAPPLVFRSLLLPRLLLVLPHPSSSWLRGLSLPCSPVVSFAFSCRVAPGGGGGVEVIVCF